MPKLTKTIVEALEPSVNPSGTVHWDTQLAGFGVRVFPSGARKFVLKYRTRGGRQRWLTLGAFGPLTVERAREIARLESAAVIEGADPVAVRQEARDAVTISELCDLYMDAAEKGLIVGRGGKCKRPSTVATDKSRISAQIKPLIGAIKAAELTRADVEKLKVNIAEGKAARDVKTKRRGRSIVRGGRGASTRVLGLLGSICNWGVENGYLAENPVKRVRRFASDQRKALLTAYQYRFLGAALDALAERRDRHNEPRHNAVGLKLLRFIALSGVRRGEGEGLRWREVDKTGTCLALTMTKTGPSLRPIGSAATRLLDMLEAESEFVFPNATQEAGYTGLPQLWSTVKAEAARLAGCAKGEGPLEGLTMHQLRHSFAGIAEDCGASIPTIAALLGHRLGGVTGGYILKRPDRYLLDAADKASELIDRALRGGDFGAEILRFEPRSSRSDIRAKAS
ncbi:MAG: integrase family protein [Phenylobacterium sp.]|uniref:tyrosine-type recombinase/integrase n=1 Tax=Phenylobacterium sp. TaxID=1871053 RepID=UPI002735F492|nr:integrase family protein [Phenylobacterium sp.]MDP3746626.1 integrase family protein [Phenylobacterium sp.]